MQIEEVAREYGVQTESQKRKVYVASSWRNILQPAIVTMIRGMGHYVYDFRNPAHYSWPELMKVAMPAEGFNWRDIDPNWEGWTPDEYRRALQHPIAIAGYNADMLALETCDTCILVLPSGRSASWEFGYAFAKGKKTAIAMFSSFEPELMYRESPVLTGTDDLFNYFNYANPRITQNRTIAEMVSPTDDFCKSRE